MKKRRAARMVEVRRKMMGADKYFAAGLVDAISWSQGWQFYFVGECVVVCCTPP